MAGPSTARQYTLPSPPKDPVSSLTFNPNPQNAHQLLAASWDKSVRLYHLPKLTEEATLSTSSDALTEQTRLVHTFIHDAPVLDVCWISDSLAASAALDRRVRLLNLQTGQMNVIGRHADAVSRIRFSHTHKILISCSWDATVNVWDPSPSSPSLLRTINLPDKALAMDLTPSYPYAVKRADGEHSAFKKHEQSPRLVVGLAGRMVQIFNLDRWSGEIERIKNAGGMTGSSEDEEAWEPEQRRESSLKFMLRDIRCMPSGEGYATSSVDGRIAVEFFDPSASKQAEKYAFKCHRQTVDGVETVYPVNTIAFHPVHGTFASLGGDATWAVWDAAAKKRIRLYPRLSSSLSAGAISSDGTQQAIATGFENVGDTPAAGMTQSEASGTRTTAHDDVHIHIRSGAWEECKPKSKQ